MDRFVAIVFDDEATAYKGMEALKELHAGGEITVYASAVISKSANGEVKLHKAQDSGPIGTAFGLLMGAMVGVLAGPAAVAAGAAAAGSAAAASAAATGMAAGSMTGGVFGLYRDLWVSGIDVTVLDKIALELEPGRSCLVASLEEVWTTPLDVRMKELKGKVFRRARIDVVDHQIAAEMTELDRELDELDAELDAANDKMSADIQAKIDGTKKKIREKSEALSKRADELNVEITARVDMLNAQIDKTTGEMQTKLRQRKEEILADYQDRKTKLQKAASLAADALS